MVDINPVSISLASYNLTRPEKIIWQFPAGVAPLEQIKSSSLKKFLTRAEEHLHENQINWSLEPLSVDSYSHWLTYYRSKMFESGFRIMADETWYDQKIALGCQVLGLMFYRAGELVASGIISLDPKTKTGSLHFKASNKLDLSGRSNSSIGAVVDYFFLRYAFDQKLATVTSGRSRNAFGIFNTLGYLDFKLKFGYLPTSDTTSPTTLEVPTLPNKTVAFFGLKERELKLYHYCQTSPAPDLHQLLSLNQAVTDLSSLNC